MKQLFILSAFLLNFISGFSQSPKSSATVTLNGTNIYYEIHGRGKPLFLLHGFTQSSKSWLPFINDFANDFEVYLVDLKGHGKSGPFTDKLSIKAAASDLDALVKHLKLERVNAIGFSYGGDILFQLALLHPGLIQSMISIGACGSWRIKDFPQWVEFITYKNISKFPWMKEQQTSDAQIRTIFDQILNYDVSVSEAEMKTIQAKTLIVLGDLDDSIPLDCVAVARKNLPQSYLWILPNTGHSAHTDKNKDEFVRVAKDFLGSGWPK